MGCGVSSMGGGGERNDSGGPLPSGIRPLLRRRLEEMKKRSHASVLKGNQTLSKKELLGNVSSDDGDEIEEREGSLRSSAKVAPAPALDRIEEQKEVIYQEKKQEEKDQENVIKKDEEEEEEDEGRMSNFDERMICAGSPSFKVYCTHDVSDDDDDHHHDHDHDHQEKDGGDEKELMGNENVTVEPKEEGSIEKIEKKEKKGKRFGMALPRKYLATVAAPCYAGGGGGNGGGVGLGCMGNHNNHHSRIN